MVWLILIVFLVFASLMYTRRLPALLALPLMAVIIILLSGIYWMAGLQTVFQEGATRLAGAMTNAIFGAILAHVVYTTGIAENIVKRAAELGGDRPFIAGLVLALASALCFTSIGGLGSVIMVGTVVLPVLSSVGFSPLSSAAIFLFSISVGGVWNLANWGFYRDVLQVPLQTIQSFAMINWIFLTLAFIAMLAVDSRRTRYAWETPGLQTPLTIEQPVPRAALVTPLVPIVIMLFYRFGNLWPFVGQSVTFDINVALLIGALYGVLTTRPRDIVQTLTAAVTEGIKNVAPVIGLMMGIGMAVTALTHPLVKDTLTPFLQGIIPSGRLGYVLFFGLLAPLALYRGPLNLYGLGAGVGAVLTGLLPSHLVMGALMSTGLVQGVCDPTNTHNVWTAGFTNTDVNDILRKTLPWVWAAAILSLATIGILYWA